MAGKSVAVDVGVHSIKVLAARQGKLGLQVTRFGAVPSKDSSRGLAQLGIPLKGVVSGLAGRAMNLRYSQVPPTPDWQLRKLMDLEIQDLASQSGGELSADYNLLPIEDEEGGTETVLLALARSDALQHADELVASASGSVDGHVPNCIALYNAYLAAGSLDEDAVVCLCNIGHETVDLALVRGVDLLFARNLSGGGKVLDEAISSAFNVSSRKAESLKRELLDLDPQSRGRYASGQAEKVTLAAGGSASVIVSGIQSSLSFCKSQTKIADLELDKVLICGGSARVRGLRGMLREALRCPVELFDPFEKVDLAALPEHEAEQLQAMRLESVVAFGLAAGRLDDSLYSLEILPERIKRRKEFAERTIYNVAAVLVALVLLVFYAKGQKEQLTTAQESLEELREKRTKDLGIHNVAKGLVEENEQNRVLVDFLTEKSIPLHGVIATMRALRDHLPDQIWVRKVEVLRRGSGGNLSVGAPRIRVDADGKELNGVDVGGVQAEFTQRMRADPNIPPSFVTTEREAKDGSDIAFTFTFDFQQARKDG